jgi:osmotically inducible protein OsmC
MRRRATAHWQGTGLEGSGTLTTTSGVLDAQPYSARLRFQDAEGRAGTNPEELVAAAHAGCFAMALSFQLSGAGFVPESLQVEAVIDMAQGEGGWSLTQITLHLDATVPGIAVEQFHALAAAAKAGCPISKALAAVPIHLEATLR